MKSLQEQEDLRVRRTHKLLWQALMAELSERTFEEITVRDICERAMVHRTTFYKHYEDKYALLEQGMRQMYDTLLAEVDMPAGALSADDPTRELISVFAHVAEHRQFYKLMLCGEGIGRFQKLVKDYMAEHVELKMSMLPPATRSLAISPSMYAQFFSGAFISTLTWWLDSDMSLSPEQMTRCFLALQAPLFPDCPPHYLQ